MSECLPQGVSACRQECTPYPAPAMPPLYACAADSGRAAAAALLLVLCCLSAAPAALAAPTSLSDITRSWADSYSIGGRCYCDSTFEHGLAAVTMPGPDGSPMPLPLFYRLIGEGPVVLPSAEARVYYNDIQCGNGPSNSMWDEVVCPGRVDLGDGNPDGCSIRGPFFSFPDAPIPLSVPTRAPAAVATAPATPAPPAQRPPPAAAVRVAVVDIATLELQMLSTTPGEWSVLRAAEHAEGFTIRAEAPGKEVDRVWFRWDHDLVHVERVAPYVLSGNRGDSYNPWNAVPGSHNLQVAVYSTDGEVNEVKTNIFVE